MDFSRRSTVQRTASRSSRLVDVRKTYVMGHATAGGGGLLGRRGPVTTVTVHALRGVSVDFYPGEYIAIMGASGSGKSTMLNLLGCLDRPTSGQYILGDHDVARLDDDELSEVRSRYIGFIFQSYNLIQQYTVLENIQLPLTYQGSGEITEEVQRADRRAGPAGRPGRPARPPPDPALRRPAAARGDRPLADQRPLHHPGRRGHRQPRHRRPAMRSWTMLGRLNDAGKTIIMVTHEDDIAEHAKRIIRMRDGLIIDDGPSPRMQPPRRPRPTAGGARRRAGLEPDRRPEPPG